MGAVERCAVRPNGNSATCASLRRCVEPELSPGPVWITSDPTLRITDTGERPHLCGIRGILRDHNLDRDTVDEREERCQSVEDIPEHVGGVAGEGYGRGSRSLACSLASGWAMPGAKTRLSDPPCYRVRLRTLIALLVCGSSFSVTSQVSCVGKLDLR